MRRVVLHMSQAAGVMHAGRMAPKGDKGTSRYAELGSNGGMGGRAASAKLLPHPMIQSSLQQATDSAAKPA